MMMFLMAFFGACVGTLIPGLMAYHVIKNGEKEINIKRKEALNELVEERKAALQKMQSNIHDAIVTGKIKTMGSRSKLYPFDDDDDGDSGSGGFN